MKKTNNRTILFLGLLFILLAFGCIVAVFRQVLTEQQDSAREVQQIKEKMAGIDAQKMVAQREVKDLASRVGRGLEFKRLIAAAKAKYGDEEQSRQNGDLWIDREGKEWLVTLGVLNGISKGSRLRVYDKEKQQIGVVVVEKALDVVSYVYPVADTGQFVEDTYEVEVE